MFGLGRSGFITSLQLPAPSRTAADEKMHVSMSHLVVGVVAVVSEQPGAGPLLVCGAVGAKKAPLAHVPAPAPAANL